LFAAALSWVLPAGEYQRRDDPSTGRRIVVGGTYHEVEPRPVGPIGALVAIPRGLVNAGEIVFFVFLIGGALAVVDRTGALRAAVEALARRLAHREALVVPVVSLAFATGGALEHTKEETIALVPALLLLTRRLGYDPLTAVAMSIGAAFVGAAFSPIDPFQVGIAQQLAELPLLSGAGYRLAFMAPALVLWIQMTARHAASTRGRPDTAIVGGEAPGVEQVATLTRRQKVVLALFALTFVVLVYGVLRFHWGFNELSALFFAMGVVAGLVGGLRVTGTAEAFADGFRAMAYAALLIGFARAIYVTLEQGRVVDTIVHGLFAPLADLPVALSAAAMTVVQAGLHVLVPSPSGQAVLTMPVLVPLSDLLGLSRQVTVLAYQYGAGLCELLTPTNGALMAVLAAAGVPYQRWLRFLLVPLALLYALSLAAVALAVAVRLG
jgi:uncharacterized ion transporter superfamily protein YfcC